jgi:hypothetical protein
MESDEEKLERLEMMTEESGTWDLSVNDIAAIQYALDEIKTLEECLRVALSRGCDIGYDRVRKIAESIVKVKP